MYLDDEEEDWTFEVCVHNMQALLTSHSANGFILSVHERTHMTCLGVKPRYSGCEAKDVCANVCVSHGLSVEPCSAASSLCLSERVNVTQITGAFLLPR